MKDKRGIEIVIQRIKVTEKPFGDTGKVQMLLREHRGKEGLFP